MADQPFDLSGKKALVTGGNSGIGLGMAKALAAAGAEVCVWGTNEAKNEAAAAELAAVAGGRTLAMRCTVAEPVSQLEHRLKPRPNRTGLFEYHEQDSLTIATGTPHY